MSTQFVTQVVTKFATKLSIADRPTENFIDTDSDKAQEPVSPASLLTAPSNLDPDREPLRILLIGSRKGVNNTILTLYRLGFAKVSEWSPLLPAPNPGEVMSILTRYIQVE